MGENQQKILDKGEKADIISSGKLNTLSRVVEGTAL